MAVTAFFYGPFFQSVFNKEIDIDSDALKVMLTTSAYTPDQDSHRYKSSITNEISGTGYAAGGVALPSVTVTYTAATNVLMFDAPDVAWSGATFTARYAIIYDSTPSTDATRPLIGYVDFGADVAVSSGTLTLVWNASGIAAVTVS